MYPGHFHVFGVDLAVWNAVFLIGVLIGYAVLRLTFLAVARPASRLLWLRYIVVVYVATLGAQFFSYALDLNGSLTPPDGTGWSAYYLNPIFGSKTLYGAIVFLPFAVWLVSPSSHGRAFFRTLDLWTPALMTGLGVARIGCLAQGCCYGVQSNTFGLRFEPGSSVYVTQVGLGQIAAGDPALPTVPTQALCALVLFGLAGWAYARLRRKEFGVFVPVLLAYSACRFLIEFLRADPERNYYGPLTTSQWIALIVVAVLTLRARFAAAQEPSSWQPL